MGHRIQSRLLTSSVDKVSPRTSLRQQKQQRYLHLTHLLCNQKANRQQATYQTYLSALQRPDLQCPLLLVVRVVGGQRSFQRRGRSWGVAAGRSDRLQLVPRRQRVLHVSVAGNKPSCVALRRVALRGGAGGWQSNMDYCTEVLIPWSTSTICSLSSSGLAPLHVTRNRSRRGRGARRCYRVSLWIDRPRGEAKYVPCHIYHSM